MTVISLLGLGKLVFLTLNAYPYIMFKKVIHFDNISGGFGQDFNRNFKNSWLSILNLALFFFAVGFFVIAFPRLVSTLVSTFFFIIGSVLVVLSIKTKALSSKLSNQPSSRRSKSKVILHED